MIPDIAVLRYPAPEPRAGHRLLVMLPGAGMEAQDFSAQGFVGAVRERDRSVEIVAARVPLELYLDGQAGAALHRAVIEPALARDDAEIWLLGISLGGMGALLHAALGAKLADGIVLLAPFLGTPGTIARIEAAGGLLNWRADAATTAPEARMLLWLQDFATRQPVQPKLFLGFGEADRFARGHRLLAACLPPARVVRRPGGHDWDTWLALWRLVLDAGALARPGATPAPPS